MLKRHAVDGSEVLLYNQLRLVVHPIIYKVLCKKKGGFMPDFCDFAMFVFDLLTCQHRQGPGGSLFVLLLMMEILTSRFVVLSTLQVVGLIDLFHDCLVLIVRADIIKCHWKGLAWMKGIFV